MKIFKSKIFKTLVAMFIIGIFLGVISYYVFGIKDNSIIHYFESIKNEKFNYSMGLLNSIKYNYKYLIFIWIAGIIFIFAIFIPFIECFRGVSIGFTLSLIIYTFKLKGLILALIMVFPCILINELTYLLESYYSISFASRTYKVFKNNKNITLKYYIKNYFLRFLILGIVLFTSCLFEIYITSNIIKYVL